MAEFIFNCPLCAKEIKAHDSLSGGTTLCPNCKGSILIPMPGINEGTQIAGYHVIHKLGSGGMGEVWLAEQTPMERKVALKILSPALINDPEFVKRFMAEVKTSAKLQHPNIVTAFDAGSENGIYYLAISFVDGVRLDERLASGPLPEKEALLIIRSIAEALKYAWEKFKILHRDIKPSNIMINTDGEAKLMDMGISKSLAEETSMTMTGVIVGTPHYMSPEQGRGEPEIDFRADLYSLGATLYHLLTGEVPFDSTTAMGILTKHITEPLPLPRDINPDVSRPAEMLIQIMMAKNKEERHASWDAAIRDINLVISGRIPKTKVPSCASSGNKKPVKKTRTGLALATGFLIVLIVATVVALSVYTSYEVPDPEVLRKTLEKAPAKNKFEASSKEVLKILDETSPEEIIKQKERRIREMWELSLDFANKNPLMADMAVANFEKVKKEFPETKYAKKADEEIKKIREKAQVLKKESIGKVIENLHEKASVPAGKKNYAEAEKIFRDYNGKYAPETSELRNKIADGFAEKAKIAKEEEERKKLEQERKKEEFFNSVAENILKGKFSDAIELCESSPYSKEMPSLKRIVNDLKNANRMLFLSLKEDIGKSILIETSDGPKKVKLKKMKGPNLYCEVSFDKGFFIKVFTFKNVPEAEKMRRLASKSSKETMAIYKILKDLKSKKYSSASQALERFPVPFKKAMEYQIEILRFGSKETRAKKAFASLSRKADIKDPGNMAEEIMESIKLKKFSAEKIDELRRDAEEFTREYEDTSCYKEHSESVKAFFYDPPPEIDVDIGRLFRGKILRFDKSSLEIELLYDFNDPEQMRDWHPISDRSRQNEFIEDGKLIIQSRGGGGLVFSPSFSELEVSFEAEFLRELSEVLMGQNDNISFIIGSFGGRTDICVRNVKSPERQIKKIGPTEYKPEETVKGRLTWKNSKVNFYDGKKDWPELNFESPYVKFAITLRASRNKYSRILFKGKLDRNWVESEMKHADNGRNGKGDIIENIYKFLKGDEDRKDKRGRDNENEFDGNERKRERTDKRDNEYNRF